MPPITFMESYSRLSTGAQMTHVPYRGTAPALNDLIAGHIQVLFSDAPPALPQMTAGKVRALGVTTAKQLPSASIFHRSERLCAALTQLPGRCWLPPPGRRAPSSISCMPKFRAMSPSPEGQKKLLDMGLIPAEPATPDQLARFVESEIDEWGKIVHLAGAAGIE